MIIEKLGRKILLLISDAFICISMIGVAVFFKLKESCGDQCQTGDAAVFVEKTTVDDIGFLPLVNNSLVIILVHLNHPRKKLKFRRKQIKNLYHTQVSLLIFVTAFSIGFGPIPWVLNVEMMPPEARVSLI